MSDRVILFLDFDGVLHPYPFHFGAQMFCGVPRLKEILAEFPEVDVVVHSSWRCVPDFAGADGSDLNDYLDIGDRFLGVTNPEILSRWESITDWLSRDPRPHVILDDFGSSFPTHARPNLICTQGIVGMTDADWEELRHRLQGFRDGER